MTQGYFDGIVVSGKEGKQPEYRESEYSHLTYYKPLTEAGSNVGLLLYQICLAAAAQIEYGALTQRRVDRRGGQQTAGSTVGFPGK